jgi:hypothetical protein
MISSMLPGVSDGRPQGPFWTVVRGHDGLHILDMLTCLRDLPVVEEVTHAQWIA